MSELLPVSGCDNDGRTGDVVFVHGLGGNSRDYWMSDKSNPSTFWPGWLGEERPDLGVWSLGYDAAKLCLAGLGHAAIRPARSALALLDTDGIGERPVVFITHSMGGLLVKQMIQNGLTLGTPVGRRSRIKRRASSSSPRRTPGPISPTS